MDEVIRQLRDRASEAFLHRHPAAAAASAPAQQQPAPLSFCAGQAAMLLEHAARLMWSDDEAREAVSLAGGCGAAGAELVRHACLRSCGCALGPAGAVTVFVARHQCSSIIICHIMCALAPVDGVGAIAELMRSFPGSPSAQANGCLALMALVRGEGDLCTANQWLVAKVGGWHTWGGCLLCL